MTEKSTVPSWVLHDGYKRTIALQSTIPDDAAIFTTLFAPEAPVVGPLNGCIVSVKALFDVAGHVTQAGSARRLSNKPAIEDAAAVSMSRAVGASLIGHTNMMELACSGLGLNPHFGTPENALFPGAKPADPAAARRFSRARLWQHSRLAIRGSRKSCAAPERGGASSRPEYTAPDDASRHGFRAGIRDDPCGAPKMRAFHD